VVPIAFAIKGGPHARRLWQYKSQRLPSAGVGSAEAMLRALLLVFLRDHGACVWRAAASARPTHLAVVPTGRGRPGMHPLRALIAAYVAMPWADVAARPGSDQVRDLDPDRFTAAPVPGGRILLIYDTWTTGSSVQSAAMALRQAGAAAVAAVVLGRHLSRAAAETAALGPAGMPFQMASCAVHRDKDVGR